MASSSAIRAHAGVVEHEVVAKRLRQRVVDGLGALNRRLLLLDSLRAPEERETSILLVLQNRRAGILAQRSPTTGSDPANAGVITT